MAEQTERQKAAAKRMEEDKAQLAKDREARIKAREEHEKKRGRPTPTQEELDMINLGHHVELSPSGAGPDPFVPFGTRRQSEPAEHHGGYQTRQSTPAQKPARSE